MNKILFERVCELEAKLDLEIRARWLAEQRVLNLEQELSRLKYLLSQRGNDEPVVG